MKIFAAGISTETNTFSPIPTGLEDFRVQRGIAVLDDLIEHPSLNLVEVWGKQAGARGDSFVFSLMASAQPSGMTVRSAYETLRSELLEDLRSAMPVDIVLLQLHGAMMAEGYEDCEEDLIRSVRDIIGPTAVIGVELDLHCHLSESKLAQADLVITYKEYPHTDVNERARELFDLAVATKCGDVRPCMALFDCRMMGIYPTSQRKMREFVDAMTAAEGQERVLSLSFGHGFPFADTPHVGAKMLAITDNDPQLARQLASEFGRRVYALRREISFGSLSLPMEQALHTALTSAQTPVVVADQSDNAGGGAPGDSTFALRWLIEHKVEGAAIATLYDPEVVKIAKKVGQGATLRIRLGGKLGPSSGDPLDLDVTVMKVIDDYIYAFPLQGGEFEMIPAGAMVALNCAGIDIVVSDERCQCFSPAVFSDLGIDPKSRRILIPKSTQHFYAAFSPIAASVIYMAAPGAVSPNPREIPYRRVATSQLYPWSEDPLT